MPVNGLRGLRPVDAETLLIADRLGLDPPAPQWLAALKSEAASYVAAREKRRADLRQHQQEAYDAALAQCPVRIEARPNLNTGVHSGQRESLVHAVPARNATSDLHWHPAGRPLCERGRARLLGDPVSDPVTCIRCLGWIPKIGEA